MAAILDIGTERFSNSESPCQPDASHQVLAQSDFQFGKRMWFEECQDGGHLGYWIRTFLAFLNFHNTVMPPIKFKLNQAFRPGAGVI